jgi:hypothetical protein
MAKNNPLPARDESRALADGLTLQIPGRASPGQKTTKHQFFPFEAVILKVSLSF